MGTLALALLLVACEGSTPADRDQPAARGTATPETSQPTPSALPRLTALPRRCLRWTGSPQRPEVTFSKRGRLFAIDPATQEVRCIDRRDSRYVAWGPRGDRVLLTGGLSNAYGESFAQEIPSDNREMAWSRPTGTSVVYVTHDYERLQKEEVSTGKITDISFLDQHFDVAYHPAGTHIAVAGSDERGRIGLFLATNEGTEVQRIVRGEEAGYIDGLAFSHDGRRLYFRGHHEDHLDLHSVPIVPGEERADTKRDLVATGLRTVYSGAQAPYYSVSPYSERPRILRAACFANRGDARITVGRTETVLDPSLGALEPVGWLPDHTVVFIAFERRCDDFGEGDLYSWKDGRATLLVENVEGAAIRARLPAAPDPPARAQGVVA